MDKYLGSQGYLATIGLHGYAVGDEQVQGVMKTGSLSDPAARTNTIAENAVILGQYIDNVQSATGAEKVDLVVHSMGGMISRYYIDRIMTDVDLAQLIILGTPMAGQIAQVCLPRLGFYCQQRLRFNLVTWWEFFTGRFSIATVFHSMPLQAQS